MSLTERYLSVMTVLTALPMLWRLKEGKFFFVLGILLLLVSLQFIRVDKEGSKERGARSREEPRFRFSLLAKAAQVMALRI